MIKEFFKKNKRFCMGNDVLQNKTNMFTFYVVISLIIAHVILMPLYIYTNSTTLILFNAVAIILYIYFLACGIKKVQIFSLYTFFEIIVHMILAVNAFGWAPGFQNWSFGIVCAFFLPSLNPYNQEIKAKRPVIIGIIFTHIYYILFFYSLVKLKTCYSINELTNNVLFILNTSITFLGIIGFSYFYVTKSNIIEDELSKRADYDQLTSLSNRYSLNYIGNKRLSLLNNQKPKLDVAIIDIDHFKNINDTYGHDAGDIVLEKLARILRMYSIKEIKCGRWGGEEFVLISNNSISHKEFVNIVKELREYVETHKLDIGKKKINITISAGIAQGTRCQNLEQIVALADKKLYKAKKTGRNKVVH